MLADVMEALGRALYGSFPIALGASFLWGLASMVLSPCHLVSVPLVMGYLSGDSRVSTGRERAKLALLFAMGMTVSIAVIGLVTGLLGRIAGDIGRIGDITVAVALIYVGISISGLVELPLPGTGVSSYRRRGNFGAFSMGLVLGAALGPCTFAFMAPVLALMFQLGSERLGSALLLGLFFASGHGLVVVFAGSFSDRVQKLLHWSGSSGSAKGFRIICGALVVAGGVYIISGAL